MCLRICWVSELLRHEIVWMFLEDFLRFIDSALHEFESMSEDYSRAICPQKNHAFQAYIIGHCENRLVALGRAHHRQADSGVSARCLHDRASRLQPALPLCRFDHA